MSQNWNNDSTKKRDVLLAASQSSGKKMLDQAVDKDSLITWNPAPDASAPNAPTSNYRIVKS